MSKAYRTEQDKIKEEKIDLLFSGKDAEGNDKEVDIPLFVWDFYGSLKSRGKKLSTIFTYMNVYTLFFAYLSENKSSPLFGAKKKDISPQMINGLKAMDIERFFTSAKISPTTYNKYHSAINALFNWMYKKDLIDGNVLAKVDRASIKSYERQVVRLTDAQSVGFIDSARMGSGLTKRQASHFNTNGYRDLAICLTLIRTGLRVSELVSLDIRDINFKESSFDVIRKGNKPDTVYFDEEVKDSIVEYLDTRSDKDSLDAPLFTSTWGKTKGKRITVRQVEHIVKKYTSAGAKGTGLGLSPHKLRATFATAMLNETGNITLVQSQLAHENIQTTSLYIDSSGQGKKEARNLLMKRDEKARELDNPLEDVESKVYKED